MGSLQATERFEAAYPILKEVALAGASGSKAMKQVSQQMFGFAILAAGEGIFYRSTLQSFSFVRRSAFDILLRENIQVLSV